MEIFAFSCINFELTSIKQTTLNKQVSTLKKYMLQMFSAHFSQFICFSFACFQFSFIFTCDKKLAISKIFFKIFFLKENFDHSKLKYSKII